MRSRITLALVVGFSAGTVFGAALCRYLLTLNR